MEIKISIEKKHLIVFILVIVLLGLVVAQNPPNPGHDFGQISGNIPVSRVPDATPNCASNPTHVFCNNLPSGWTPSDVAISSGKSRDSEMLVGTPGGFFCRSNGVNCQSLSMNQNGCRWVSAQQTGNFQNLCNPTEYMAGFRQDNSLAAIQEYYCCVYR